MAKGKTHAFGGKVFSEIPAEILNKLGVKAGDTIEFLNPYGNLVLLKPNSNQVVEAQKQTHAQITEPEIVTPKSKTSAPSKGISVLAKGYAVVEDHTEVQNLTSQLKMQNKDQDVIGVRGFDKRYYIISKEKLRDTESAISKIMDSEKNFSELLNSSGLEEDLLRTAIEVMREEGSVIEKRKNVYVMA